MTEEMSSATSDIASADRLEKRIARAKQTHRVVTITYSYEILLLAGFYLAGYVELRVLLIYAFLAVALCTTVAWLNYLGWSQARDPRLYFVHQIPGIALALSLTVAAPQISFQPFGTLLAIATFGFLAPHRWAFVLCSVLTLVGTGIVIALVGPQIAMPTATTAGQVLTWGVLAGVLGRCIWVAQQVRGLQRHIREKNEALNAALARIEILANKDELTGLDNRRSMGRYLADQIELHNLTLIPLTVALVDIDHFKSINDRLGHASGDKVLAMFATRLAMALRSVDRVGRYGGEEFMIVLPATNAHQAEEPLQGIRADILATDWSSVSPLLRMTATIGAAEYKTGESAEDVVKRADAALYRGKETGRNRVVIAHTPIPYTHSPSVMPPSTIAPFEPTAAKRLV
jgi:diguanylate cyclase (GGDEF)-like protein